MRCLAYFLLFIVANFNAFPSVENADVCNGHNILFTENQTICCSKEILRIHNNYRNLLATGKVLNQPRAMNLKDLKWDEELASTAQDVANRCRFEHSQENTTLFEVVGQNIFMKCTNYLEQQPYWHQAIEFWFDENKLYTYPEDATGSTGHYTQLVWADTKFIGCGYVYYKLTNGEHIVDKQLLEIGNDHCGLYVCHYGPAGNYKDHAPYLNYTKN